MKLFAVTVMSLSLLASPPAHANEASASSGASGRDPVANEDSQKITITRSGSQPSRQAPAEYFTGSVSTEFYQAARALRSDLDN